MSTVDTTGRRSNSRNFSGAELTQELTYGFFLGRTYRAFKEFTVNTQMRFVATKPFMLTHQELYADSGTVRAAITVGSTPAGVWTVLPTKFGKNGTASPVPTPNVVIEEGGTLTGGTLREVIRINSEKDAGGRSSLAGTRILPAGTYYISIVVTGTTAGMYSLEWEELD